MIVIDVKERPNCQCTSFVFDDGGVQGNCKRAFVGGWRLPVIRVGKWFLWLGFAQSLPDRTKMNATQTCGLYDVRLFLTSVSERNDFQFLSPARPVIAFGFHQNSKEHSNFKFSHRTTFTFLLTMT